MNGIRTTVIAAFGALLLSVVSTPANEDGVGRMYADEQALVSRLSVSLAPQDQRQLADMLREGLITGPENPLRRSDREGAIRAYRRAMELGDTSPAVTLALARLLLRSEAEAFAKMEPALRILAAGGASDASYLLALAAQQNGGRSDEQVVAMFKVAALMGSDRAVGDLAAAGIALPRAIGNRLVAKLQDEAETGDADAAFDLYKIFAAGQLVDEDDDVALKWLRQSADAGEPKAMLALAEQLAGGETSQADKLKAVTLYRNAAEKGSAAAAMALGRGAGAVGSPLEISLDEARLWLRRALDVGVRGAGVELANLDFSAALHFTGPESERLSLLKEALVPIVEDPYALTSLAEKYRGSSDAKLVAPLLLPLMKRQALNGDAAVGLGYNAWLASLGRPLPEAVGRALFDSIRRDPLGSRGFSNFLIANLALDGRLPQSVITNDDALSLLFEAADANVGQAMLRLGQLYLEGDRLAYSEIFAKRWLIRAREQAVERASWELAQLGSRSFIETERQETERFYLAQMDDGDPRAALALARMKLRSGNLDGLVLARIKAVTVEPLDQIALANVLISSGLRSCTAEGRTLLDALAGKPLDTEAMVAYGQLRMRIAVSPKETADALSIIEQAARSGEAFARLALASTYFSSVMYTDKRALAVSILGEILEQDPSDPEARLLMSKAYLMGLGVKRDARKAGDLIAKLHAERGYDLPKATMLEADWLAFSSDRRDPAAVIELLDTQAARGSVAAERALAEAYLNGFGQSIQPDMAASRLYRAANSGDKEAMAGLGHVLLNGYGVSESPEDGLFWLARAADAGNTTAMYDLSHIFALGPNGETDPQQAMVWLRRAADRNHPNAAYQLGLAYLKGDWVARDVGAAATWFERSAQSGSLLAGRSLKALRKNQDADLEKVMSESAEE